MQVIGNNSTARSSVNTVDYGSASPYNYSVKVCNPKKKSLFVILQLKTKQKFESVDDLKRQMLAEYREKIGEPIEQLGYIEPGHGLRGKQRWLSSNNDLNQMYLVHKKKPYEITLWCLGPSGERGVKRPSTNSESEPSKAPRKSYDKHLDRMARVEEIEDTLREKHDKYTDEQLRSWAHMYIMKKHDSLEVPPDKPFWRGPSKKNSCCVPKQTN